MFLKAVYIVTSLLFTPIQQGSPEGSLPSCTTPTQIEQVIKAESSLTFHTHQVLSGEDARELGRALGVLFNQSVPGDYPVITYTVVTNPSGQRMTLIVLYNEEGCAYSRAILNEPLMDQLRQLMINSRVRL